MWGGGGITMVKGEYICTEVSLWPDNPLPNYLHTCILCTICILVVTSVHTA